MTKKPIIIPEKSVTNKQIKRRNFIAFGTFFLGGAAAFGGWRTLYNSAQETAGITGGTRKPLRRALNQTELFFRRVFSHKHLVKTYPLEMAANNVRVNSDVGLTDEDFKPGDWQLNIVKGGTQVLSISIEQLKKLPKTEIIYDFKCVEGWDQIQHWGGLSFATFVEYFNLTEQAKMDYVGMETPDGEYYVGIDRDSVMHPQTLLAYEMNGKPITLDHGAPLRLIIPVKYGIKNLKRIGKITFSDQRPPDYWAEQGYDYYSGL
jgi:DMSO/TMAO reductase YedYZ molybdopterin-dependent catalytic subunit